MNCPRDHSALNETKVDDVVLDRCAGCGGIWLDAGRMERMLSRDSRSLRKLLPDEPRAEDEDATSLVCPRCSGTLIRMRGSPEPIIYHGCLTCYGHWLDGSQLKQIAGRPLAGKFEALFRKLLD